MLDYLLTYLLTHAAKSILRS